MSKNNIYVILISWPHFVDFWGGFSVVKTHHNWVGNWVATGLQLSCNGLQLSCNWVANWVATQVCSFLSTLGRNRFSMDNIRFPMLASSRWFRTVPIWSSCGSSAPWSAWGWSNPGWRCGGIGDQNFCVGFWKRTVRRAKSLLTSQNTAKNLV